MKCQNLFSGKNKNNIIKLSSVEVAQRMVNVKSTENSSDNIFLLYNTFEILIFQFLNNVPWSFTMNALYALGSPMLKATRGSRRSSIAHLITR